MMSNLEFKKCLIYAKISLRKDEKMRIKLDVYIYAHFDYLRDKYNLIPSFLYKFNSLNALNFLWPRL